MKKISSLEISLNDLDKGCSGITATWGKFLSEASACCLESKSHISGVEMIIEGIMSQKRKIFWNNEITEQTLNAWHDTQELTEYGASGVAIALILKLTEYSVIQRAVKGEGVDYWLGKKTESFIQKAARLEISGIFEGNDSKIKTRIKQKLEQTCPTDGEFPAFIVVVEFTKPISHLLKK